MSAGRSKASSAASVWVAFGATTGQRQGGGGQRFAPAGGDGQRQIEKDRGGARRLQESGLHPALLQAERTETRRNDGALLRTLVRRHLFLCRRQQFLGLLEAPESDQGEGMIGERTPRLGEDGRALADRGAAGRNEEGHRLLHAAGPSSGTRRTASCRLVRGRPSGARQGLDSSEHGHRAEGSSVEAEPPRREFVRPGTRPASAR